MLIKKLTGIEIPSSEITPQKYISVTPEIHGWCSGIGDNLCPGSLQPTFFDKVRECQTRP